MAEYDRLPIFGLHTVLFPEMSLPLHIFEPRYRLLISQCQEKSEPFGIVLLKSGAEVESLSSEPVQPHSVGTLARITRCEWQPDGRAHIEVVGETRFLIAETFSDQPYMSARVTPFWEQSCDPLDLQPLFDEVASLFRSYLGKLLEATQHPPDGFKLPPDPVLLSYAVANLLPIPAARKQQLLATSYTDARLREELEILQGEREISDAITARKAMRNRRDRLEDATQSNAAAIVMQVDGAALRRYLSKN